MRPSWPELRRRALLPLPFLAGIGRAEAAGSPAVLAPGPEDGATMRWAHRLVRRVGRVMPGLPPPVLRAVGGPDGVTAANRFIAGDAEDGHLLLALAGPALLPWLSGSPRASYDPAAWLPVCLSWRGAMVAGRGPLPAPGQPRAPIRVPLSGPETTEAGVLLALETIGLPAEPAVASVAASPWPPEEAFAQGEVDAVLLTGPGAVAQAQALGATPWFGFGQAGEAVRPYAAIPALDPARQRAVLAVIGTAQLHAALILPRLTSSDMVAAWRQAGQRWRDGERAESAEAEGEPLADVAAVAALASLTPPPEAVLAWRSWLSRRLGWRPA
ncbi:hypothetical protein LPC08_19575 [Roseomonas sp. OT10]|uniref:hypothetical protein n=1 Tax=Roseomonas cutis TaxID=2897332 RepID=UPI001E554DC3|nr:hypothetical protein [Roseomonas sp. OT10]UFN48193.1 hypothetical protein LPC08_19575 [Roseomonas sp. OT10]